MKLDDDELPLRIVDERLLDSETVDEELLAESQEAWIAADRERIRVGVDVMLDEAGVTDSERRAGYHERAQRLAGKFLVAWAGEDADWIRRRGLPRVTH